MADIAEVITSMGQNLKKAYDACEEKSAEMPTNKNLANLAATIETVKSGGGVPVKTVAITSVIGDNGTVWRPTDGSEASSYPLTVSIAPEDAAVKDMNYRTTDAGVCTIAYNGVTGEYSVKPVGNGTATITATAVDGSGATDSRTVSVRTHCTGIHFTRSTVRAIVGQPVPNKLSFTPSYTSEREVTYTSSDTEVVDCSSGTPMAVGAGYATITAVATDGGYTDTIEVNSKISTTDWSEIARLVREGRATDLYELGDKIPITWTDNATSTVYETNLIVESFRNVEKEGVEGTVPGMVLMFENSLPFTVQFDAAETRLKATEQYAQTGVYYYDASYNVLNLSEGDEIPYDEYSNTIYKTGIAGIAKNHDFISNGYNRWSHSGIRQFLNSDGERGNWWTAAHVGDVAPSIHTTKEGFMSGLDPDFVAAVGKVKIGTCLNTVTEDGSTEYTYDRFFLPSYEQMFYPPESGTAGEEGTYWEYIKQATGWANPSTNSTAARTIVPMGATSAAYWWLRSAYRANSYYVRNVDTSGGSSYYSAYGSSRCVPACVIC